MNISTFLNVKALFNLDKRIMSALLYRGSQAVVGVLTILIITFSFQPIMQGYYYTFASLLALQIIFEMGLAFVILQFIGHEFAALSWSSDHKIKGDAERLMKFDLFLAKAFISYGLIAVGVFCVIFPAGMIFFKNTPQMNISWKWPWFFLCLTTAMNVLPIPFLTVIEGSGLIIQINLFRSIQNTLGAFFMWLAMIAGGGLLSIALDPLLCFIIAVLWFLKSYPDFFNRIIYGLRQLGKRSIVQLNWSQEIWPMQWRIAISWISGYFLSQIYVPILFHYQSAVAAGKLGASLTVCNMLGLFAATFFASYNPQICQLIAGRNLDSAHSLFKKIFMQSLFLTIIIAALVYLGMLLPWFHFLTNRFVTPSQMLLMLLATLVNSVIGAMAQFLRAFKREPFVWVSLIGAILNATLAWYFGSIYGTMGIIFVFLFLNILYGLPTAWFLWQKYARMSATHLVLVRE